MATKEDRIRRIIAQNKLEEDVGEIKASLNSEGNVRIESSSIVQPYHVNDIDGDRWNEVWSERAKEEGIGYWRVGPAGKRVFFKDVWGVEGEPSYELVMVMAGEMSKLTKRYCACAQKYNESVADFIAARRALVDKALEV
jgi:hypothetical protein